MKWELIIAGLGIVGMTLFYTGKVQELQEKISKIAKETIPRGLMMVQSGITDAPGKVISIVEKQTQTITETVKKLPDVINTITPSPTPTPTPTPTPSQTKTATEVASEILGYSTAKPTPIEVGKVYFQSLGNIIFNPFQGWQFKTW